jgi:hypothetical protein
MQSLWKSYKTITTSWPLKPEVDPKGQNANPATRPSSKAALFEWPFLSLNRS